LFKLEKDSNQKIFRSENVQIQNSSIPKICSKIDKQKNENEKQNRKIETKNRMKTSPRHKTG
jgi:hypothetical protein